MPLLVDRSLEELVIAETYLNLKAKAEGLTAIRVPDFWISQSHSTIHTQYGVQPFVPFDWQREFIENLTPKEMVLKSRDVGSSEICVRYFCWLQLKEGGNILIKADKHENAKNLVSIARHYLTSLPEGERPTLTKDNETELELQGIGTIKAMAQGGGRSERCKYLLMTERAFWDKPDVELAAISGALVAGGYEIIESTANGFNEYHELWVEDNAYRKTFVSRHDNPTHDPKWWQDKQEQLAGQGNKLLQEYPETPNQAFVASGNCVFEAEIVQEYLEASVMPKVTGLNAALSVWVGPVVGRHYVAGADVAEGIDIGNNRLDYSHLAIYDFNNVRHVASLHGQWAPDVYAQHVYDVCKGYHFPYLGVERNSVGVTVLTKLLELGYPPERLYHETDPEAELKEHRNKEPKKVVGWRTTRKSKPVLNTDLAASIQAREITSYDKRFWDQCLSYVHKGDGTTGAQAGCHDDMVIAHGIAVQMRKYARFLKAAPGLSVGMKWGS